MRQLFDPTSFSELFIPATTLLEIFLRGTLVYLALFAMLRFVVQRGSVASASMTDLLALLLISNAVQNALIGDSNSVTDAILLVAVIIFWSYTIDWLSLRSNLIRRFAYPRPIKLIENGKLIRKNMQKELINEEQIYSVMRQQGIEDISEVKEALIEPNGLISVIPFDGHPDKGGAPQQPDVA